MAKKQFEEIQDELFPVTPEIRGLAISQFRVKDGAIDASLSGATLVTDIAMLNDDVWRKAVAEWLVNLCGNGENVQGYIDEARARAFEIERDREFARAAMDAASAMRGNVTNIHQSLA
jgi:hypothetical protein